MNSPGIPQPPLFILDDDNWLDIYRTDRELIGNVEGAHIGEVVAVFDAEARPLKIGVHPRTAEVEGVYFLATQPDLSMMLDAVESFFLVWTENKPPPRMRLADGYVRGVLAGYRKATLRRRRSCR